MNANDPSLAPRPQASLGQARVLRASAEEGVVVGDGPFHPAGGGQPGDSGWIDGDGGRRVVIDTRKVAPGAEGCVALIPEPGATLPPPAPPSP